MNLSELKNIWQVPRYLPYVQPVLTDETVKAAEEKIGHKLPKEYIELLKIQNGGYIRYTIEDTTHSQIYGIGPHFPSLTEFEWLEDYEDLSFELKGLIPFDGDGHWNICLDYRKSEEPEITYIDTESDEETLIAKNFKEYLSLLTLETNNEWVIETNESIEDTIEKIESIIDIEFEEPDSFANGYPVYRSEYEESWIWVSSNKVPAAFIREEEERYEELKSEMKVMSVRYPNIPENSLLISFSDEEAEVDLTDLLEMSGFTIYPLT